MPSHFDFDSTHRILRCRLEGRVTDEELKNFYRAIAEQAAVIDSLSGVVDLSAVTDVEISRQTVLQLADSKPAMPDPRRSRVIIAGSPHVFGLARMFELAGQETRPNLHVVRTEQEAWAILGLEEAPQFKTLISRKAD